MIASARSINNNLTVRELRRGDLRQVSTIHLAAFPHSALTMLGHETVRRYFSWRYVRFHATEQPLPGGESADTPMVSGKLSFPYTTRVGLSLTQTTVVAGRNESCP